MGKKLEVEILSTNDSDLVDTFDGSNRCCRHRVGHLVYTVFFDSKGVCVHVEDDLKIPNLKYKMILSPYSSDAHGVEITCKRTDK